MAGIEPELLAELRMSGRSACHTLHFAQDNSFIDLPSFGDIEDDPIVLSSDASMLADLLHGRLRLWSLT
jgi:hypothetical protein